MVNFCNFDDTNLEKLRSAIRENGNDNSNASNISVELDVFNFDPQSIDWEDYLTNIHIPGVLRYVVK